MGIPERWLNKAAQIAKIAINIKNLRRGCKNVSGPAREVGGAAEKRVTSRKNNPVNRSNGALMDPLIHLDRGPE